MKLAPIELNEQQMLKHSELLKAIQAIESLMNTVVDNKQPEQIAETIAAAINLLSTSGRIMEIASTIHSYVLGVAAQEVMAHPQLFEAKQLIQSNYMKGRVARYSGLFERADRTIKSLTTFIEALRSLLSFEREQVKMAGYNQNT